MAKTLPLKIHPDPILRQKSRAMTATEITSPKIAELILDMEQTMHEQKGIGLAAVQVGSLLRLILIATKDGSLPLINPRITWHSLKKEVGEEGCLSIPNTYGEVKRWVSIKVSGLDPHGKPLKFKAQGLFARVIQHEVDHTNGILFLDRTKVVKTMEPSDEKTKP